MPQHILIRSTPHSLQVARVENHQVIEIDMEPWRTNLRVGDIYHGKVVRILPDMGIAFLEIGSERTALLHFKDVHLPAGYTAAVQYLRVGQLMPVQIIKLPRGEKGAVVSGRLQLVGGLLILHPLSIGIKLAKRITDSEQQQRLLDILQATAVAMGITVRTQAQFVDEAPIQKEYNYLCDQWAAIITAMSINHQPKCLHAEANLACTFARDALSFDVSAIFVNDEKIHADLKAFLSHGLDSWQARLQLDQERSYEVVDKAIKEALNKKTTLPSGGYILIEKTETMIVIDVNTGQYVSSDPQTDIILQTNLEAARMIAHHIQLRNLSGTMVIDFIRMKTAAQQQAVIAVLEQELAKDPVRTQVSGFSPLGLVEISRQGQGRSWTEYYQL